MLRPCSDAPTCNPRWYRLTPDRAVVLLVALEGSLLLSGRYEWFAFNRHKGWTVLVCLATVGAAFLLMSLWFLAAVVFRRRFQFGILSLLLLTVVVAVPCSWLTVAREHAERQREAVAEIKKVGGTVSYDYQHGPCGYPIGCAQPPAPLWLRSLLGDDLFTDVTGVSFITSTVDDAGLECLKGLPRIRSLWLTGAKVSNGGVQHLNGLTDLLELYFDDTAIDDVGFTRLRGLSQLQYLGASNKVSDAGLQHLVAFPQLRGLRLDYGRVSDAGLKHLQRLPQLRLLGLMDTKVSDAGLEHLGGFTQLESLFLDRTKITDAGLLHLGGLFRLQWLTLGDTKIGDAGLEHLKGLTQLQRLCLRGTKVTDAGVRDLQNALPMVKIER